jgi:hypothetical protein
MTKLPTSGSGSGEDEPWLSREELVDGEYQIKRRDYDELQQLIEKRCQEAEARFGLIIPGYRRQPYFSPQLAQTFASTSTGTSVPNISTNASIITCRMTSRHCGAISAGVS